MFWMRPEGRSDVIAEHGMVASSQPLATQAGLRILQQGGNAVDAAVATAAVLDVVEPFSTGCGGDAFALVHLPGHRAPLAFNGSGRSGSLATLDDLLERGLTEMPLRGGVPVTVPGAMRLWFNLVNNLGSLEFGQVLEPAIEYARDGFPVSLLVSEFWRMTLPALQNDEARAVFTVNGRHPLAGEIMRNSDLASVFEEVSREGPDAFYSGATARAIVETVQKHGGFLTEADLEEHTTEETTPIATTYRDLKVYEHPPNGQGFAALTMLNIMEQFEMDRFHPLSAERYHIMIEAKKLAYADLMQHNADPSFYNVPLKRLLSKKYAKSRASLISMTEAMTHCESGVELGSDTVYLATADSEGRAVSLVNSLYRGFGSGLVVPGTGIKLQNRGSLFSLDPEHPNCYAPKKRPFHTIIPAATYKDIELHGVFGIMGGAHQAQAHAQFIGNVVDHSMLPQAALDHPRFNHDQNSNRVALENGIPAGVQGKLRLMGHMLLHETQTGFGGGQAIFRADGVWIAGSDRRKDGQASGW